MDVTASLVSIVDAAWKVTKYLKDVKKGGSERQQLDGEVLSIYHLFHGLRDQFSEENIQKNETYLRPIRTLLAPNGIISQLKFTLEEITAKLHKASQTQTGKIAQSFLWPFQKDDAKELIQRLDRLKTSVTLALGQVQIEQAKIGNLMVSDIQLAVSTQHFREIVEWISPLHFLTTKDSPLKKALPGTGRWFLDGDEFQIFKSGIVPVMWCSGIPGAGKTCLASAAFEELAASPDEKTAVLIAFCAFDVPKTHNATDMLWSLLRQVVEIKGTCSERVEDMYTATEHGGEQQIQSRPQAQQTQSRPSADELCKVLGEELNDFEKVFLILDGLDEMPDQREREDLLNRLEALDPRPKLMVTSRPLGHIKSWFTETATEEGYRIAPTSTQSFTYCEVCYSAVTSYYECVDRHYTICFPCFAEHHTCETCKGEDFDLVYSGSVVIAASPEDIEQYVNSRIDGNSALKRLIARGKPSNGGKDLRSEVIVKVKEDAQEMFLLARFHMDVIEYETSPNGVRRALKNLPRGINETFDRTFDRIERLGDVTRVKRLISYVAYSNNILTVEALNHAVAIESQNTALDEDDISFIDDLTSMCAGLIEIGPEPERYVRLAHETIGRYINESQRAPFLERERPLAIACLTYLRFSSFDDGACYGSLSSQEYEDRMERYPFLAYAALHWGSHVRTCSDDEVVKSKTLSLLRSQPHVDNAAEVMWYCDLQDSNSWDAKDGVTGVHLASFFGLPQAISELVGQGVDPNSQDCLGTTALMYAASKNYPEVVVILLHSGAIAATVCSRGSTALHRASRAGSKLVVKQLVDTPQDIGINVLDTWHDNLTALMLAIWAGSIDVVKLLLQHPDIDANLLLPGSRGTNALLLATTYNQEEIVDAMLNSRKVNVNAEDMHGSTALSVAACYGRRAIVETLLKHNADANIRDSYGGRPFLRAIDYNNIDVVRLFLEHKVDWTFKDFLGRSVLHGAAVNNRARIMRLILETGKKTGKDYLVNEKDNKGETPLFDAARRDFDECVKVLLEFGARTDMMNNSGKTPVWSAFEMGAQRVIPLLREYRGKEVAAQRNLTQRRDSTAEDFHPLPRVDTFGRYKLSLHAATRLLDVAAFKEHLSTCRSELVSEINTKDEGGGQTPLHIASQRGESEIVESLLASGAFLDVHDQWGWTPLQIAVQYGNTHIVKILVTAGADVNATDDLKRTALDFAIVEHLWLQSAFFLVSHGANFDPCATTVVDLLSWAAAKGELAVAKTLVEKGVPFQLKDEDGYTPYQRAKQGDHTEVAEFLLGMSSTGPSDSTKELTLMNEIATKAEGEPLIKDTVMEAEDEMNDKLHSKTVIEPASSPIEVLTELKNAEPSTNRREKPPLVVDSPPSMSEHVVVSQTPRSSVYHSPLTTREMLLLAFIVALIASILLR